jgi:hypothetical protein
MEKLTEVKIGHYRWRVEMVEAMPEGDHWGETDHEALTIRVKRTLPEPHRSVTVLHEICHAALANCGINEHDELHINALSMRLVEILRDNPALVAYLLDDANQR